MTEVNYSAPLCACGNPITKFFKSGKPVKCCTPCRDKQDRKLRTKHNKRETECAQCGKAFVTVRAHQKFCSGACRSTARDRANGVRPMQYRQLRDCKSCGKAFKSKSSRYKTYCTRECAFAAKRQASIARPPKPPKPAKPPVLCTCVVCGVSFQAQHERSTCSVGCSMEKARRAANEANREKVGDKVSRPCKCCDKVFTPEYGNKRSVFCSDRCSTRFGRRHQCKNHRHRAKRMGVVYEPVNRLKVFERDGWRCQICSKPTPRKRMGSMYSNAPELDHRVPMSKGGSHTYSNVQCACRQCNNEKGNKTEAGQLPLLVA